MAFSSRLLRAVISSVRSPSTSSPDGRSTLISMPADSADRRQRASASFTSSSTSTADSSGSRSAPGQPRQRDQLGDQRAQPRRLLEDPRGEAAHLGGVVRGVEHGLGQQPHRADGRLQLVADVRDEVAPGGLQAHGVRAVGGLDHREPVAEPADLRRARRRAPGRGAPAATGRPRSATRSRCRGHLPAGRPGARVGDAAADHARARRRAGCAAPPRPIAVSTASPASDERNTRSRRSARVGPGSSAGAAGAPPAPARAGARGRRHRRARPAAPPQPAGTTPAGSRPHGRRAPRRRTGPS